jgi:hypothetical protein
MKTKPTVWYVDDLKSNLDRFATDHKNAFTVRTFDNPQQVMEALKESKPDALLCDIFFYDTERESQEIEDQVQAKARQLREFARTIGADKESYQAGIKLIESVSSRFKGHPRFPIYAYTSKAPTFWTELDSTESVRLEQDGSSRESMGGQQSNW